MTTAEELRGRLVQGTTDRELRRLAPGLNASIALVIGNEPICLRLTENDFGLSGIDGAEIMVVASEEAWLQVLASPPPPTFQSFTAWQIANPHFEVSGDPLLIAQARPALERLVELLVGAPSEKGRHVERDVSQIAARYSPVNVKGQRYDMYSEVAGN